MIKSKQEVTDFARAAIRSRVFLWVNILITTVTIITGATGSYVEYGWAARALIHYLLMLYYIGLMYAISPTVLYHSVRWNIPLVVSVTVLYVTASFPDAYIQHIILKQDGMMAVLGEMGETAAILFPGIVMFLLYMGDQVKDAFAQPASDCPVWWPVSRQAAPPQQEPCAFVEQSENAFLENLDDVLVLQAQNQYTKVTHRNGETIVRVSLSKAIDSVDETLGWRVHRSYWINKDHVAAIRYANGNPRLVDKFEHEIPMSRNMVEDVRNYLASYYVDKTIRS